MIYNISIDVTNHCNFDCVHCLRDKISPRSHIHLDVLELMIREASSVGIKNVCLTGGEPALHPELKGICNLLMNYGVRFSLVSNGFLFEEKILPLFNARVRRYLNGVCFSLDGSTAASHDMIRREGSFDKVISSIDACVRRNTPVSVKSILHKQNCHEVADVAHLCASKKVETLGYVLLTPTPRLIAENLMPTPDEYMEMVRYIMGRIAPSFSMIINVEGYADPEYRVPFCNPAYGLSTDHEGNLIFCCNLSHPTNGDKPDTFGREYLGNIREIGIEEGIMRHYRTLAWFMDKVMRSDQEKERLFNCRVCFQLFGKLGWMNAYESADY